MPEDPRVQRLIEEILDSDRTPEEVCVGVPELLPEVRDRYRRLRAIRDRIGDLFPEPGPGGDHEPTADEVGLPEVPGYEVTGVLGHGGVGVVYKALHLRLNRPVALKMLLAGSFATRSERLRFAREAEMVAGLRHPNVVPVYDVGDHQGRPYFTMEFLEGGSLAAMIAGTPRPARRAAELLATLADAIGAAHRGGIVHRDLKPSNVLLAADGTPKVGDFGLARRLELGSSLTQTGAVVGTPSYMAPEQARGGAGEIGPAVDLYALGAVLYELLTGRPPFRGESAAETVHQVITRDPVPPSRLNAGVPRDLETICLMCLHKAPERRYAAAPELAEDLRRFLRGEPIRARRSGAPERLVRWARRRPGLASATAASLVSSMALVGVGFWLASERAATVRSVEDDLRELAVHQRTSSWRQAEAALQRAAARLGGGGPGWLRLRLDRARRDQELVARLERIRSDRSVLVREGVEFWDREYERAFVEAGLGGVGDDPAAVAGRVRASVVRHTLIDAIDDWALCADYGPDPGREARLLEVARRADPDPRGWRDRFRDPAAREDRGELARLAESADLAGTPVTLLVGLGELLKKRGGDAIPFLKRVQRQHPEDFWANANLASALDDREFAEALRYYQVAMAIRPGTPGLATNCAVALFNLGRHEEAVFYARQAVRQVPDDAKLESNLGLFLASNRQDEEAVVHYRRAVALRPELNSPRIGIRESLLRLGRRAEAADAWRERLRADPAPHTEWDGYAELCLFLGREGEYRRARRALLDRFGKAADPNVAERTARACLLLPAPAGEVREAAALIDRILADEKSRGSWAYPYFLLARALAEYRLGRTDAAVPILQGPASQALVPAPQLILAMCRHRLGQEEQARKALATAVLACDWAEDRADSREKWIYHALRREAEAMILPDLPGLLEGKRRPRDNDERVAMLGTCQARGLHDLSASLYAEAFEADPKLLEADYSQVRYLAARSAALAGSARGRTDMTEPDRARRRKQAIEWLRAELAALGSLPFRTNPGTREWLRAYLVYWRTEIGLAGVREVADLADLPEPERQDWRRLWDDHAALLKQVQDGK